VPFHVLATWPGQGRAYALNWTADEVQDRLVDPYQTGSPVVIQGQQFDPRFTRFQVVEMDEVQKRPSRETWQTVERDGKDVTERFLVRAPTRAAVPDSSIEAEPTAVDQRTVMVIYGRDDARTDALFQFLRALDLKPLEWGQLVSESGEGSPYIGAVLDRAFSIAQAAVVLFTPDDEARLAERLWTPTTSDGEKELRGQARPNVFFEAGMSFGKFPNRTVLVEIGDQRQASDLTGRHAVRLDNSPEKRNDLAERLAGAGCPADRSGDHWLSVGDFA
jgi:predicted nucleotide-binding protein